MINYSPKNYSPFKGFGYKSANILKRIMDNLQVGDILTRISDGSKWRFLHYKPIDIGMHSVRADYKGDDYPPQDKNSIHVTGWDTQKNDWKANDHEEFATSEFQKV